MTTPEPAPASRRQLGAELARLRTARGILLKDVAAHLGTSPTRAGRMESGKGRVTPRTDEIVKLCELYGVTDEHQVQKLVGMVPTSMAPGWWEPYRDSLPAGLDVYFGLELSATSERAWEPVLVHGLLQTPDYARAVVKAGPAVRPSEVEDLVDIRAKRQAAVLTESATRTPLNLWAILDEAVVTRPVGGPEVMRAQLRHLIDVAELPHVTLQIVPIKKGAHPGLGGSFSILDFAGAEPPAEPPVVYVDSHAGNSYLEKPSDVRTFTAAFDLLIAAAADPTDSTAILHRAAKEMT
ncbi:helix-turn-helix domain-containing protein [Streptomyces sp. NPDC058595]|uniref:helix-turn-helix domain-containing protein n=1 Tax=Streptomyces sp. NPDC058595 TaxID=3346550 RepID=UPI0036475E81